MARDVEHVAAALSQELGPLRRAVSRAVRASEDLPDLPDNQIEVLRAVVGQPGMNTVMLAAQLQLARPTVSNLLNTMRRAGLVELPRREDDARAVEVHATARATEILARFDRASGAVLATALAALPASGLLALESAVPVLADLNRILAAATHPQGARRATHPHPTAAHALTE